jgi:hypothetical protein
MGDARRGCCHRGGDSLFMRIFRQTFVIDSALPAQEAWKKLLTVVKTTPRICAECGQTLGGPFLFALRAAHAAPATANLDATPLYLGRLRARGRSLIAEVQYHPHHFVPELLYSGTPGTIRAVGHGTRIVIEMTMHPMGYLFRVGSAANTFGVLSTLALDH